MFDTTGRLIFTDSKLKNDSIYSNFLDVSSFAKGIYFVEIAIGNQRYTQRMVVN
ncbi:MAG: T9SS type A sorting domain-containing protein [Chitinophagales bacterium]